MANQNLSQFGEKLFVADADHTFIWDTAASISKRVSRNSWLNSGTLTSDAPVTISQTWNALAQTFKALVVNAAGTSDANSASGSLLLDLQLGGVSRFNIQKNGSALFRTDSSVVFGNEAQNSTTAAVYSSTAVQEVRLSNGAKLGWTSTSVYNTLDTILVRDSPSGNTLALRNGAAAQTFRVYNTYTDANSYERAIFSFNSNRLEISTGQAGAGVSRKIDFGTNGATGITFFTNTTNRWGIGSDGHFVAAADNTYDIGASTGNRPRDIFLTGTLYSNTIRDSTTGVLSFVTTGSTRMTITGAGNVGIGTTAPGANLHIRNDQSAFTGIYVDNRSVTAGSYSGISLGTNNTGGQQWFLTRENHTTARFDIGLSLGSPSLSILVGGNVGIGTTSPTSKLQVSAGDVEVDTIAKGVILKSPDGTRYRVTVANGGTLSVAAV